MTQISPLDAQISEFNFHHISIDDGLSDGSVYAIMQDSQGFIWIGTQDGLNRFDGDKFKVFKHTPFDSTSLVDGSVRALLEDSRGQIWVGTRNGLSCFEPVRAVFQNFVHQPADSFSLGGDHVESIFEDSRGRLWIGTNQSGLNLLDRATGHFKHFVSDANNKQSISHNRVRDIAEGANGRLWIATLGGGLNLFDPETGIFEQVPIDELKTMRAHKFIMSLHVDQKRPTIVWLGTYGGGLLRFDSSRRQFEHFRQQSGEKNSVSDDRIFDITTDATGRIWLATFDGGLNVLDYQAKKFECFKSDPQKPRSLGANFVRCIFLDRAENLWIGTNLAGLNKIDTKPIKFTVLRNDPDEPASLANNYVNAIAIDGEGALWVGTNKGLDVLRPNSSGFMHLWSDVSNAFVSSLVVDESEGVWFGTFGKGLYHHMAGSKPKPYVLKSSSVLDNRITALYLSRNRVLWVGTINGLCALNLQNKNEVVYQHDPGNPNSLSQNRINCLLEDKFGNMWIGTLDGGLNRLEPGSGDSQRFQKDYDVRSSLSHDAVNCLFEDAEGDLWIGTNNGLDRMSRTAGGVRFEHFFEADGLSGSNVRGILSDALGNLWVSTGKGISKFIPKMPADRRFKNYGRWHGLEGQSFMPEACGQSRDGLMYFGSIGGVVRFNPLQLPDNPYSPPLAITSFKLLNQEVELDTAISRVKCVKLAHNENTFSIEFAALDFTESKKNRYAHKMEGLDEEWINAGARRYVSYAGVEPGEYRFLVKGANNDGIWNEIPATLNIIIAPPYWQTWWFRLSAGSIVLLLVGMLYNYRVSQLLEVERTRNRIAKDLHDNVGATLSSISYFAQAIRGESQISKQPVIEKFLSLITEGAAEAQDAIADIIWSIDPANDSWDKMLAKFRRFASDLLESRAIRYSIDIPDTFKAKRLNMEWRRNLWLIFKEMITNAVKHSRCQSVKVRLTVSGREITLLVADDGVGFDTSRDLQGNGLRNILTRAKNLNGMAELTSEPGKGTSWNLRFPMR